MRTKGSVGSVAVRLSVLNRILKPNAEVLVSKRFYDAISLLISSSSNEDSEENEEMINKTTVENLSENKEVDEAPIPVQCF
jgi:hypothetical protein